MWNGKLSFFFSPLISPPVAAAFGGGIIMSQMRMKKSNTVPHCAH